MSRPALLMGRVVAPVVVVGLAVMFAANLVKSKPQPPRAERSVAAPLVEVLPVEVRATRVSLDAMGTVRPTHLLVVQPQVSGAIIDHHPSLVTGGLVAAGDVLLTVDARDYELQVERQRAQVAKARLDLRVENGRQAIAQREWDSMAQELSTTEEGDTSLARREPQVEAARAGVKAARGAVRTAMLSLDRTVVTAPFNAVVREEAVEVGQVVGPGYRLATLVGTDAAWVEVSVPVDALNHLVIPGHNATPEQEGSEATVTQQTSSGTTIERNGQVVRMLRDLDPRGRMARLIVQIDDPMELSKEASERRLPLLTGAFVSVRIEGATLDNVVSIPREALRDGRAVWVCTPEKTLAIRPVEIAWREKSRVLIKGGLEANDQLIVSPLSAPVSGMAVRVSAAAPVVEAQEPKPDTGDAK